jgi:glycosyltransferase involved in cell wall biosynthesis
MRILMLSDGETKGGASMAAARMAQGLAQLGHEVLRVVRFPDAPPPGRTHPWRTEVIDTPPELVRDWLEQPSEEAQALVRGNLSRIMDDFQPHAVSVHNLHGATRHGWSAALVRQCAQAAPTVWTLHDLWSATGRCAYTGGCDLYISGSCDTRCPTWDVYPSCPPKAIAARMAEKYAVLAACPDLVAASPSAWLAHEARRGIWGNHRVEVVANGLDLGTFSPTDRTKARRKLGLPEQGRMLLAVSLNLNDPRKGMDILFEGLPQLAPDTTVLFMGGGENAIPEGRGNGLVNMHSLGLLTDDATKVLAYSAADALVYPSREDNLPNTVAESLACGTPVAGFALCGVTEMLEDGAGVAASEVSPVTLVRAIEAVLDLNGDAARRRCRELAQQRYDLLTQAGVLAGLFEELMDARARKARLG